MKDLVILGAGGFGREVAWLVEEINKVKPQWNLLGFIDEDCSKHGTILNGYKVLGDMNWLEGKDDIYCVCALGSTTAKKAMVHKAKSKGVKFATLIDPYVRISSTVEIGEGTIICTGNVLTVNIKIGEHVGLHVNCNTGHDTIIDDFATILPGSNIAGHVHIGEGCFIGTGASIINDLEIGRWTTIGAGAAVVRNIPSNCTAVGVPARVIKYHEEI